MKSTFFALVILVMLSISCKMPASSVPVDVIPAGKGLLAVTWAASSRALLGSAWASTVADQFELIALGESTFQSCLLKSGVGGVIALDPGTYRVILLAGVKKSSGSATSYLVGSAVVDEVSVIEGNRTTAQLTLKSLDLSWNSGGVPVWQLPWSLQAAGATGISAVGMSLAGSSTSQRPRFKSAGLWGGYKEVVVSGTPEAWQISASATIPDDTSSVQVEMVGAGVVIRRASGDWFETAGACQTTWTWPSHPELAESHPLFPLTLFSTTAEAPATGLTLTVGWE